MSDRADADRGQSDSVVLFRVFTEISIIHQLATTAFAQVLPYGLTPAQFAVLNHCTRLGDNRTPADIASALQVTRGTLTSTLGRLKTKGFIRLVPDPSDGRSKRVLLTPKGRAAREDAMAAAAPRLIRLSEGLQDSDLRHILPVLETLRAWMDANR